MPFRVGEKLITKVIVDCDYTLYSKSEELDRKIWDPVEEKQIFFLMTINDIPDDEYEDFKLKFHASGKEIGYFATFIKFGGTEDQFKVTTSSVDVSKYLAFDQLLKTILYLLSQKVEIFIYSGSPLESIEKVLNALIGYQNDERRKLIKGIWGKEKSDEHGLQKVDKRTFELMLKEFDADPTETLFVDDLGRSLDVAQELGLNTVKVNPEEPLKTEGDKSVPSFNKIMQLMKFD